MRGRRQDAGFTLVEVLVAMFIFALISAGTMTALTGSLRGKAQMNERLEVIADLDGARALMKSDFSNINLREMRDNYGGTLPYVLEGGTQTLIEFTRAGRANPGGLENRSEFQRVSYVFDGGNLIRRTLAQTNPAPQTGEYERILLSGLAAVKVTYHVPLPLGSVSYSGLNLFEKQSVQILPGQTQDIPEILSFDFEFSNGDHLVQYFELAL